MIRRLRRLTQILTVLQTVGQLECERAKTVVRSTTKISVNQRNQRMIKKAVQRKIVR